MPNQTTINLPRDSSLQNIVAAINSLAQSGSGNLTINLTGNVTGNGSVANSAATINTTISSLPSNIVGTSQVANTSITKDKIADGAIDKTKLADNASNTTLTVTLTSAGWSNKVQSVTATGVTASNTVIVAPIPAHTQMYQDARIYASAQAANRLTFQCTTPPPNDVQVNVVILR